MVLLQEAKSNQDLRKFTFEPPSVGAQALRPYQVSRLCVSPGNKTAFDDFSWQNRFYDPIIRDEKSLDGIREYIINNPLKWELDRNNPANLYM